MKNYFLILILFINYSCNAQNKSLMVPEIDNRFERFDSFKYDSLYKKNSNYIKDTLNNGTYIEMNVANYGKSYSITTKDSYYTITKVYYPNGIIKTKGVSNNTETFQVGIWYEFDEEGKLVKEIDYDKPYKFTFEDILKFCEKEKIEIRKGPILQSTGWYNEISRSIENGQPIWRIEHLKKTNLIEIIKLDGVTGKVLGTETYDYINN